MSIWYRDYSLDELRIMSEGNMLEHLAIEFTEIGEDCLTARMPVDRRTKQPAGLLHGGASVVLAETLGSVAANLCIDPEEKYCVGQEVNANHLRPVSSGFVTGVARPLQIGRSAQVWEIRIHDERDKLVCVSRLTMAVLAGKAKPLALRG
ncbi:hotdog fold thioesterase [uncultured Desulfuromonas sp.]|uniref:hotdog fold thioesterase n=1 Tax=uncultured Desulfuromonas sp. TaxID=181013 RepID=UPI00262F5DCD|nr:hotdog fold thioesterase [uncultured Desulfuromonas sp.]